MVFFRKMDRTGNYHVRQNKPYAERQSPTSHMKNMALKSITISYNNICINTFKCTFKYVYIIMKSEKGSQEGWKQP